MTAAGEEKRGPRGRVGDGKPGRNFRRRIRPMLVTPIFRAKSVARALDDGRAWLARKAAGR